MTSRVDRTELLGYFDSLSNWGRWGQADRLGTVNFVDAAKRVAAARLITSGVSISCSRPVQSGRPGSDVLHFMTATGQARGGGFGVAADWIGMPIHAPLTHIDAHAHVTWQGQLYNGASAADIDAVRGARVGSIETLADGVFSRGVVLDLPLSVGREWLEPGEAIYPADLEACEDKLGVRVGPGDVLLVRTGHDRHREINPTLDASDDAPGLHASCLPWLYERSVAVLGSDAANDVLPSGFDDPQMPIHAVGMVAMGMWLLDKLWLESLVARCVDEQRWEFCFVIAPLRLKRSTGSPLNPLAIF